MSEKITPQFNDEFEPFYGQLNDLIVRQIRSIPFTETDDFNKLLLSSSSEEGASEMFSEMCRSIPDEALPGLVGLVERIEQITVNQFNLRSNEQPKHMKAFSPDFGRAELLVDGLIAAPIADRNSIRDYLIGDQVTEALESHMEENHLYVDPDETVDPDKIVRTNTDTSIGPRIRDLPETFDPMRTRTLFAITTQHYWIKGGEEKYIYPEDTVEEIVKESPDKYLIPLLLCLEEDYIIRLADGSPRSLVKDSSPRKYFVEDGIVWQLYTTSSMRKQMAAECMYDPSGFGPTNFNFAIFRSDYIEDSTGQDALGEQFEARLDEEIQMRYQKKTILHI